MISSSRLFLLISILVFSTEGKINSAERKYKVFQLNPTNAEHLNLIHRLHNEGEFDFWKEPTVQNATAEIMIGPDQFGSFSRLLNETDIPFRVIVEDLGRLIAEKEGPESPRNRALRLLANSKRDEGTHSFGLSMGNYYDYPEIQSFMQRVHSAIPTRTRIVSIGKTVEGRDTQAIQFGNPSDKSRPVVWIDAGIHAREWASIHSATYFIQLIANAILDNRDPPQRLVNDLLRQMDILILPVANPDGYTYTRVDPSLVEYRMWRKNRSPQVCQETTSGKRRCCSGVDLNRNFAYKFSVTGTSFSPCSEIYHGSAVFSEPESRNIRDAVMLSDLRGRIQAFVTMHAYSQLLIYPYSDKKGHYPEDISDLRTVANKAVVAMADKFGTHYTAGTGPEIIYSYTGGSSDWAKETARIKYSYTIELRPGYYSWNGFILEKSQLIPTARETFDGILVIMEAMAKQNTKSKDVETKRNLVGTSPTVVCADRAPNCAHWLSERPTICRDAMQAMMRECRRTCAICKA